MRFYGFSDPQAPVECFAPKPECRLILHAFAHSSCMVRFPTCTRTRIRDALHQTRRSLPRLANCQIALGVPDHTRIAPLTRSSLLMNNCVLP